MKKRDILVRVLWKNIDTLSKNPQTSNFMTIGLGRAELFNVDGRTDGQADTHDGVNNHVSKSYERA
jgi:hypothetical protein